MRTPASAEPGELVDAAFESFESVRGVLDTTGYSETEQVGFRAPRAVALPTD